MKHFAGIVAVLGLWGASPSPAANPAPTLRFADVVARCGAELEAASPGALAQVTAMGQAGQERAGAADPMMMKLNDPEATAELLQGAIQSIRDDKYDPFDTSKEKDAAQLASDRFEICRMQLRIDQLNGTYSPPAPLLATPVTVGLDPAQADACSRDIKAMQVQSQGWPGTAAENAARLGQYQKDLFEGRCAGHPETAAYLGSANRMLSYSAATGGVPGAKDRAKRSHVPGAVATQCLAIKPDGGVNNRCDFAIEYVYCVSKPTAGSWSASFDCSRGKSGAWQIGPRSTAIMQTSGEGVQFFACRYGPSLSKPDGISPADFRPGSSASSVPTGRCKEWGAP